MIARRLAVDALGNAALMCTSMRDETPSFAVAAMYRPDGGRMWVREYQDANSREVTVTGLAVSPNGKVAASCNAGSFGTPGDGRAVMFGDAGSVMYRPALREIKDDCGSVDGPAINGSEIAVDRGGSLFLLGKTLPDAQGRSSFEVIRYED